MAAATWARRVAVRSFVPVVAVVGVGMAAADRFETCERTTCASKEEVMASLGIKAADTDQSTCPPDREELGRGTWALLHSMAAYYPDQPRAEDVTSMRSFILGLARFYPCSHCAEALRSDLERLPPTLETRESLVLWVCRQHNFVNESLGKPTFTCSLRALDERWRDGRPGCWQQAEQTARESLGQAAEDDDDDDAGDAGDDDDSDGDDEELTALRAELERRR